jgi:hypothetical protein
MTAHLIAKTEKSSAQHDESNEYAEDGARAQRELAVATFVAVKIVVVN